MISQPVNQVRLTNIAIVRLKRKGRMFEVPCYKNQIMNYRQGLETDLDEVLQIREVFKNVNKGIAVKHAELFKAFRTQDFEAILREILDRGTVQVSEAERTQQTKQMINDVANIISEKCIHRGTNRLIPVSIVKRGLKEINFNPKLNQSAKKQALKMIPKLADTLEIMRANMRLKFTFPAGLAEQLDPMISEGTEESREGTETLQAVVVLDPERFRQISDELANLGLNQQITIEVVDQVVALQEKELIRAAAAPANKAPEETKEVAPPPTPPQATPEETKASLVHTYKCTSCPNAAFSDIQAHRAHFKTEWHRVNLKLKMAGDQLVTEDEFAEMTQKQVEEILSRLST